MWRVSPRDARQGLGVQQGRDEQREQGVVQGLGAQREQDGPRGRDEPQGLVWLRVLGLDELRGPVVLRAAPPVLRDGPLALVLPRDVRQERAQGGRPEPVLLLGVPLEREPVCLALAVRQVDPDELPVQPDVLPVGLLADLDGLLAHLDERLVDPDERLVPVLQDEARHLGGSQAVLPPAGREPALDVRRP